MRDRITIRMSEAMIARIDAWIAVHPDCGSRQEAVRRVLEYSLPTIEHIGRTGLEEDDAADAAESRTSSQSPNAE
jgi:hypothetical protein